MSQTDAITVTTNTLGKFIFLWTAKYIISF